ncbi:MAG: hypothetical protein KKD44_28580 [Proteobacteria bacterium]|nr:hypothetical protein [Pseudomonadota bacterium]
MNDRREAQNLSRELLVIKGQIDDAEKQLEAVVIRYSALYLKNSELLDNRNSEEY